MTERIGQFEIQPATDDEAYDAFVRSCPEWTAFHLASYRRVIERAFGHACEAYVAIDAGVIAGALQLATVKSRLFGHYLVSMPFVSYGGALGSDEAVAALSEHAARLAAGRSADLLELRSRGLRPLDLDVSRRKVTVLLDLPSEPDELWTSFKGKLRSQIRRPQKEGYETRFGVDQVGPFWQVFSHHMRDLGTPVLPRRFFEGLASELGDDVTFGCVYDGEQAIAGGCTVGWRDEVEISWASSLRAYNRTAPNMLLYWSFMERAIGEGRRVFNFGRCTPGEGTHRFKLQWGGRDEQLHWIQWSGGRSKTPSPGDGGFGLAVRVWQRLPLSVANALGPRIVRNIP